MESPAYISAFAALASQNESTTGAEAAAFMGTLKPAVCNALKALMQAHPTNPVAFLAEHLQKNSTTSSVESHLLEFEGVEATVERLKKRKGSCVRADATASTELPLIGLLTPSMGELRDAVSAVVPFVGGTPSTVHVVVQRDARADYVAVGGEIFAANLSQQRVTAAVSERLHGGVPASPTTHAAPPQKSVTPTGAGQATGRVNFAAAAPVAAAPEVVSVEAELAKRLQSKLSMPCVPLLDAITAVTASVSGVTVRVHTIDTTSVPLPLWAYNAVNGVIGLTDGAPLAGVVIVGLGGEESMRALASAAAAAMFPIKELSDLKKAFALASIQADAARQPSLATQRYWQQVRQRREKRDAVREQREEARRNRAPTPPHPSAGPVGEASGNNETVPSPTPLVPQPPSAAAQQLAELKKKAAQRRAARRQQEDVEFVHVMTKHRHDQAVKIQSMIRGFIARNRRQPAAFFEATSAGYLRANSVHGKAALAPPSPATTTITVVPASPLKRKQSGSADVTPTAAATGAQAAMQQQQHRDFYVGPALVRRTLYQLTETNPDLFTTKLPPPPAAPRTKRFWAPRRTRIPPAFEDDVSSEGESWVENVVVVPPRPSSTRSKQFNVALRLAKCVEATGNTQLDWALSVQRSFATVSSLQHRAYDAIRQHVIALLHVAFVELAHRGLGRHQDFVKFVHEAFWELPAWFSNPHFLSLTTAPRGSPVAMMYGPLTVMQDRLLYGSEQPTLLPWGANTSHLPTLGTSPDAAGGWMLSPPRSRVYIAAEALDVNTWRHLATHLADALEHDHIAWLSTLDAPFVYVKDRAFVAVARPAAQAVPGDKVGMQHTASVTAAPSPKAAAAGTTSGSTTAAAAAAPLPLTAVSSEALSPKDRKAAVRQWFGVSWNEMERRLRTEIIAKIEATDGKLLYCAAPTMPGQYFATLVRFPAVAMAELALWQQVAKPDPSRSSSRNTFGGGGDPNEASAQQRSSLSSQASGQMSMHGKGVRRTKSIAAGRSAGSMKAQASERTPHDNELSQRDSVQVPPRNSLQGGLGNLSEVLSDSERQQRDPEHLVATPSQTAERDVFPHLGASFSAVFQRHPMLDIAGQPWLVAFDRFVATVVEQLTVKDVDKPAVVVAVASPANMFYAAAAVLANYLVVEPHDVLADLLEARRLEAVRARSAASSAQPPATPTPTGGNTVTVGNKDVEVSICDVESTVDDSASEDGPDGAPSAHRAQVAPPREILACLEALKTACGAAVDLEHAVDDVDVVLDLLGATGPLKASVAQAIENAEHNANTPAAVRGHILAAVRGIERLSWLLLLAAFLREFRVKRRSPEAELGSFANWCVTKVPAAVAWIESIDPWASFPEFCPDPHHREYSTMFDRWRRRGDFVSAIV